MPVLGVQDERTCRLSLADLSVDELDGSLGTRDLGRPFRVGKIVLDVNDHQPCVLVVDHDADTVQNRYRRPIDWLGNLPDCVVECRPWEVGALDTDGELFHAS